MLTTKTLFETYETLNLKKFCENLNLCYQYVLKLSKTPIKGQAYDPTIINYNEIDKVLTRKNINLENYDWEGLVSTIKTYEPVTPITEFKISTIFTLRNNKNGCEVIYLNIIEDEITEIVFKDYDTNKIRVMSTDTFLHQSPRIINNVEGK